MPKNPAAVALGKLKSEKKAQAARENGKRGGRPRNTKARGHSRKWYELNGLLPKKTQQTVENKV